jgi:hypothetical protein
MVQAVTKTYFGCSYSKHIHLSYTAMKRSILIFPVLFLLLIFGAKNIFAQSLITTTITDEKKDQNSVNGRDFWFCIPQNSSDGDQTQKYFNVYVASSRNTTVNFQQQGENLVKKPVTANKVTIFTTPTPLKPSADFKLSAELHSSGDVEINNAIHIWSDDADISVFFLSRIPFSSDGMYVIPTIGWGKEYIVGSYTSLIADPSKFDYPSEFAVVANQDNTVIQVTPTQDLRKTGFPDIVLHPKGITFGERLNKGECVQYKLTRAKDESWDVSGTVINSNNPIGVIGASTCPYIPTTDQACDYIIEMMQPIRTWSNLYYTAPFAGRKYGGDGFLLLGTKDGQKIYQNGDSAAKVNRFQPVYLYDNDVNIAIAWTSDAPFMLAQYVLGSTHAWNGTGIRNQGDPSYVVINPADQFSKKVIFQIPTVIPGSGQTTFTNYVNILIDSITIKTAMYDGSLLNSSSLTNVQSIQRFKIPNSEWIAIRLIYNKTPGVGGGEGTHIVTSSKGIGVYTYGYGVDDGYAMSGQLGVHTVNDPDTIPPVTKTTGRCFCASVSILDRGIKQSGISSFVIDSSDNMIFYPDSTFTAGSGRDTASYQMCVIDSTKGAYLVVNVHDIAGNRTTITSVYHPVQLKFSPSQLDFKIVQSGDTISKNITFCNNSELPFQYTFADINFLNGKKNDTLGFRIDSIDVDGTMLKGQCKTLRITFSSKYAGTVIDLISFTPACKQTFVQVLGNGGGADYTVTNFDFGCIDTGTSITAAAVQALNTSSSSVSIDSIWTDDPEQFSFTGLLPAEILPNGVRTFYFIYEPTAPGFDTTIAHFHSPEAGEKTAQLTGCGQIHVLVRTEGYSSQLSKSGKEYTLLSSQLDRGNELAILPPVPNPSDGKNTVRFVFGLSEDSPLDLSIYDILGNLVTTVVHDNDHPSGIYETSLMINPNLQSGSYIYRFAGLGKVISGKLVITK